MKKLQIITFFAILLGLAACGTEQNSTERGTSNVDNKVDANNTFTPDAPKGIPVNIKGTVKGITSAKVFFDKKTSTASEVVTSTPMNQDGTFDIKTVIDHPGIYRLRLGANYVWLALNGNEEVQITADVTETKINSLNIAGSNLSKELMDLIGKRPAPGDLAKYIDSKGDDHVIVNLFLAELLAPDAYIKQYKKVRDQLAAKYPDWPYTRDFNSKVSIIEQQISQTPLAIGSPMPEIRLKNPDGKDIALSELKGKVVLVDFWASWCGPCRRENPNVVSVYEKYNKKGFEVFSISLDGLDDRTVVSLQNNQPQLNSLMEAHKQRWVAAIKDDRLLWPYHGSELRKWSSNVAKQFGIQGIPQAFLVDRNGVLRYANGLRGPELEKKVQELL